MAMLSILGMYEAYPTLFDGLILPTQADITNDAEKVSNPWVPNKTDFVNYICMELAEMGLVYASAPVMASMIAIWSKVHLPEWIQLYNTLLYKYNPIWNKDGLYIETRDLDGKNERTADLKTTDTRTYTNLNDIRTYTNLTDTHTLNNLTDTHTLNNLANEQTGSVEHDVTAYDVNAYSPDKRDVYKNVKNTGTGSETNVGTGSETNTRSGEDKLSRNGEDKNVQDVGGTDKYYTEDNGTITREESGNIGVTTTQAMIKEQREIVQFNLYDYMLQQFKRQFCVMIY